jgi:hypothetical protein
MTLNAISTAGGIAGDAQILHLPVVLACGCRRALV